MKYGITQLLSTLALVAGLTASAHALTITAGTTTAVTTGADHGGNQNSQAIIDATIAPFIVGSTELYKENVGDGFDTGTLAGSYETTFSNTASDPSDALIEYVGGNVVGPTAYLLVKDGNTSPWWYLYNLTGMGWTGVEDIVLTGFWTGTGAISHVTLYGGASIPPPPPGPGVPDSGATVALLGMAFAAIAFLKRKLA